MNISRQNIFHVMSAQLWVPTISLIYHDFYSNIMKPSVMIYKKTLENIAVTLLSYIEIFLQINRRLRIVQPFEARQTTYSSP